MRMRQKVSISRLPIRLGIFLLLYLVPQSLSAQENNDSTHILRNGASITPDDVLKQANINLFPEKSTTYSLYSPGQLEHIPRFSLKRDISLPYQTNPSLLFRGDYSTGGVLHQFDRGALFGSGIRVTSPCQCAEGQHVPHHRTGFQHFGRLPLPSFRPCHLESLRIIRHRKLLRNEHP